MNYHILLESLFVQKAEFKEHQVQKILIHKGYCLETLIAYMKKGSSAEFVGSLGCRQVTKPMI